MSLILVGLGAAPAFAWQLTDIRSHLPDLRFDLTDEAGHEVTNHDYQGKVTLVFFGYTSCKDECPTTMMRLSSLLTRMGPEAKGVQVLFVTVDPQHDTPDALHNFLKSFNWPIHGLTGSPYAIETMAQRYRAAYRPSRSGDDVPHSNLVYVFDGAGHARLIMTPNDADDAFTADLKRLIKDND